MENIFENAKFGDKFKTKNGKCVIFLRECSRGWYTVADEDSEYNVNYTGNVGYGCDDGNNIVSCWLYDDFKSNDELPSYNLASKIWNICDEYSWQTRIEGWTWDGAVKFIQDNWNDPDFNIDYKAEKTKK